MNYEKNVLRDYVPWVVISSPKIDDLRFILNGVMARKRTGRETSQRSRLLQAQRTRLSHR